MSREGVVVVVVVSLADVSVSRVATGETASGRELR